MTIVSPCVYDEALRLVPPTGREAMQAWMADSELDFGNSSSRLTLDRGYVHVYELKTSGATRSETTEKAERLLSRFLDRVSWESGYREVEIERLPARMPGGRLQMTIRVVYAMEMPERMRRPSTQKPESPDAGPPRTSARRPSDQYRVRGGQYRIRGAALDQPLWIQ